MKKDEVKKQWHGPMCAAMWLELRANKESLEFHKEYNLTSGPLLIDLIIVLKPDEAGKLEELDEILYSKVVLDLSMNVNANVFNKKKELVGAKTA